MRKISRNAVASIAPLNRQDFYVYQTNKYPMFASKMTTVRYTLIL
jgi:hypothetical protein